MNTGPEFKTTVINKAQKLIFRKENFGYQQFISTVFKEKVNWLSLPGCVKTLTFRNIFASIKVINLEYMFAIKMATCVTSAGNSENIFDRIISLFRLRIFAYYQALNSWGLAPTCSCLVCLFSYFLSSQRQIPWFVPHVLTLYSIDTHFDASTTDSFWRHCRKRKNWS